MRLRFFSCLLLTASLSGCFADDYSRSEKVDGDASIAVDENVALLGNQLIERRGHYWVQGDQLPAKASGDGDENVDINDGFAVVANSRQSEVTVFRFDEEQSSWVQDAIISEPSLTRFGHSVLVSETHLIIGAPISATAVIYRREQGQWVEQQRLIAEGEAESTLGSSLAINGPYLFVSDKTQNQVHVYKVHFESIETVQTINQPIESAEKSQFGWSIAADQRWLAVAAYRDWSDAEASEQGGKAHLYRLQQGKWIYKQSVGVFSKSEENYPAGSFGHSIALNGANLVVGDDTNKTLFQFRRAGQLWSEVQEIKAPEGSHGSWGYHLGLSRQHIISGSPAFLLGPDLPSGTLSAKVVDPNGFIVKEASVEGGFLSEVLTDAEGRFSTDLLLGWQGALSITIGGASVDASIDPLTGDSDLGVLVLDKVPLHSVQIDAFGFMGELSGVELQITGLDPVVIDGTAVTLELPNGWRGEIVPQKDGYDFEPASFSTDGLAQNESIFFVGMEAFPSSQP